MLVIMDSLTSDTVTAPIELCGTVATGFVEGNSSAVLQGKQRLSGPVEVEAGKLSSVFKRFADSIDLRAPVAFDSISRLFSVLTFGGLGGFSSPETAAASSSLSDFMPFSDPFIHPLIDSHLSKKSPNHSLFHIAHHFFAISLIQILDCHCHYLSNGIRRTLSHNLTDKFVYFRLGQMF
mmetsp:Transcript_21055/g.29720  ORF Transcript_21055/g.29720 Transcript_21055/m.29720 type:complete len:179 (-) Transcript_21055:401-937(-)